MKSAVTLDDGTLNVFDKPTQDLYKTLFEVAHAKIAAMFDDEDEEGQVSPYEVESDYLQAALNLDQVSVTGDRWQRGQIQNLDESPEFRPVVARGAKGRTGLYQKLAKDPTFSEGKDKAWEAMVSGFVHIKAADKTDPVAVEQAKILNDNIQQVVTNQVKLEWMTGAFDTGLALWEMIDLPDGSLKELTLVRADTVMEWLLDDSERALVAIGCETANAKYELLAEHVWLYSHRRTGNNFDGSPQIREVAVFIEMKWMLVRLMGLSAEVHGLGLKTIEKDGEINQAGSAEAIVEALQNMVAEDIPILELAAGRRLVWHSPGGTMPDFLGLLEYIDNQITKKTSTSGTHLTYNDHGSRALADNKDQETSKTGYHYGLLFVESLHRSVVKRLGRNLFGDNFREVQTFFRLYNEQNDPDRYKRLMAYKQGGLLTWTPEDEDGLRETEGLAPLVGNRVAPETQEPAKDATALLKMAIAQPANETAAA